MTVIPEKPVCLVLLVCVVGKKVSVRGVRWQKCTCPFVRLLSKQNRATDIIKLCIDSPLLRCKSYYKMKKKEEEEDKGRGGGRGGGEGKKRTLFS